MENSHGKAASAFPQTCHIRLDSTQRASSNLAIYVVDDDESIRFLIHTLVEADGIGVFSYGSAEEFLASFQPESSGCLLLDLQLPGMSGLELQEILVQRGEQIPIIFFTAQGSIPKVVTALKNGAVDFLEKPFDYKDLLKRIYRSLENDAKIRQRKDASVSAAFRIASLTPRERQVMDRIIAGRPNKHIADDLGICIKTVEFHRARIMEKMGTHSLAELVQLTLSARRDHAKPEQHA